MLQSKIFTPATGDEDNLELRRQQRHKEFWTTQELKERFGFTRVDYLRKHLDRLDIPYLEGQHGPIIDTQLLTQLRQAATVSSRRDDHEVCTQDQ